MIFHISILVTPYISQDGHYYVTRCSTVLFKILAPNAMIISVVFWCLIASESNTFHNHPSFNSF
eukprot:UN25920